MSTNAPNSNANSNTNSNANGTHGPLQVLAPFRTDPIKSMQYRHKRIDRLTATRVPEIHYIGQIVHSNNMLDSTSEGVCCRYKVEYGDSMERLSGDVSGQTHVGYPQFHEAESIPLNHPLDLHFASIGLQGWGAPHICLQCFKYDEYGRRILVGYGFTNLPITSGYYPNIEVALWRPLGTSEQEMDAYFLGKTPSLSSCNSLYVNAWKDRFRLVTASAGSITIELQCITRHLDKQGIDHA